MGMPKSGKHAMAPETLFSVQPSHMVSSPPRRQVIGPDFICIGMPKAGTAWLHDQLRHHPDFWMPPVKEVNYLLGDPRSMKNTIRQLGRVRKRFELGRSVEPEERLFL